MKTPEEIKNEIATLIAMKPNVRKRSVFGDDHHAAIDAQIEVLEKSMDDGQIYDRWESTGSDDIDDDEGRCDNVLDSAMEAFNWKTGEGDEEPPSKNWQSLIIES